MRGSCRPIDVALGLTSSTSRSMSSDYSKPVQVRSAQGRSADEHSVGRAVDPREHVEDMQDEVVTPTCTTSTAKARAHDRASEESICVLLELGFRPGKRASLGGSDHLARASPRCGPSGARRR